MPVLSGSPNQEVLDTVNSIYKDAAGEFPFMKGQIAGIRFAGDGLMEWHDDTGEISMGSHLAGFGKATVDRVIDEWGKGLGLLPGGLETTVHHEMGHVILSSLRARHQKAGSNDAFFDGLESLRSKLGYPSIYSRKSIGEWVSERYAMERTNRAKPELVGYLRGAANASHV